VWLGWWLSWLAAASWSDRPVERSPASTQILYRLLAIAGVVLLFGAFRPRPSGDVTFWHGGLVLQAAMIVITIAGFAVTWWARLHLGRLWSSSVTRKSDHRVIESGPYALVRHPIYTGITIAAFATAIMRGTLTAFAGAAVMTFGWYIKARIEESFLREQLGAAAYGDYARRVPMLVPFLTRR